MNTPKPNKPAGAPAEPSEAGSVERMDGRQEESAESGVPFGDTSLGDSLGCATVILALGTAIALIVWAAQ